MFIDIAANLSDEMFAGVYHGKTRHESDLELVLERAIASGCTQMIVLAGSIDDAHACLRICESSPNLYTTVGLHPTRCGDIFKHVNSTSTDAEILEFLKLTFTRFATENSQVIAIGELGLDYDRLHFCPADVQKRVFRLQLAAADSLQLPFLLHLRNAYDDFVEIMRDCPYACKSPGGVVHSFDGTREQMETLTQMGLYIGINGCSLRSEQFLNQVLPHIPEDKIMYETDAPYCEVKPTHPGHALLSDMQIPKPCKAEKFVRGSLVKNRNEPACINQVAHIVAKIRQQEPSRLNQVVLANTLRLFRRIVRS